MSGEGLIPCSRAWPAANPERVAELRVLVDQLQLMSADGTCDRAVARKAANELGDLADAMEAGGGLANGYAAVPLLDAAVLPAPVPPPPLPPPGGGGIGCESEAS